MKKLSHFDKQGKIKMVDVSDKQTTKRRAVASGKVLMRPETLEVLKKQTNPKGNPFEIARIAGIMAAKQTSNLIPLCHQLPLAKVDISTELTDDCVFLKAEVITTAQTGVEMEALTAVSVAALTIYDMCKAIQKDMEITDIRLETKEGGKSGDFQRE
jgi:cyclic pyranopterin phosphate synthase